MWLGSHNLCATQKEYRAQNKQMTAVGNSSDSEEIVKASQSNFQHDGAAASKLSERSPLPPALSEMDLPGGQTEVVDVRWIEGINSHPAESDEDRSPESMSDTNTWLNFNGDWVNPDSSEDNWEEDDESDIELDNGSEDLESPVQQDEFAAPHVPWLIPPTQRSKKICEQWLMTVNPTETRRNRGNKKK